MRSRHTQQTVSLTPPPSPHSDPLPDQQRPELGLWSWSQLAAGPQPCRDPHRTRTSHTRRPGQSALGLFLWRGRLSAVVTCFRWHLQKREREKEFSAGVSSFWLQKEGNILVRGQQVSVKMFLNVGQTGFSPTCDAPTAKQH